MVRRRPLALLAGAVLGSALLMTGGVVPADAAPPAPRAPGVPGPTHGGERKGNVDRRTIPALARTRVLRTAHPGAAVDEHLWRTRLGDQAVVQLDPLTGTPRMLGRLDGFLSGTSKSKPKTVVLRYLRKHAAELGLDPADLDTLVLRRDYRDIAKIHHLSFIQVVDGIPAFGNGLKANVTRRGQIISLEGAPIANLANQAAAVSRRPGLSAAESRERAAKDVGGDAAASRQVDGGRTTVWANHDRAQLVWFLTPDGLRLGWSTYVQAGGSLSYQHVLDAGSGAVLFRRDLVDADNGDALVYDNYPGAPRGGTQRVRNLVRAGYLPRSAATLSGGKYVAAWSDVNDDNLQNAGESVPVPGRSGKGPQYRLTRFDTADPTCSDAYVCTWDPSVAGSWRTNREADVTQAFYSTSRYHDYLKAKPFGFTRAAGNFEARDSDPVQLNALDGAATAGDLPDGNHVDNANMNTPPDGTPPVMQMYLFHTPGATDAEDPFVPASSAFEADVILHEYTHGLSNRLVVDAGGTSTLDSLQAGSMGEAWSDYYAEDDLVHRGLERDTATPGQILVGRYVSAGAALIRSMAIDCPVGATAEACTRPDGRRGGYTYGDLSVAAGSPEVHGSGEVWGQTLWDLRRSLGHTTTGMLVTRAMELSPADPSFLDMRNAILQADLAVYGGRHGSAIWKVFARRGMGFFAGTVDAADTQPIEDFNRLPGRGARRSTISGTVTDDTGAPLAGATVAVGGHDSGFGGDYTGLTDANGRYTIRHVVVGTYSLTASAPGGYVRSTVRVAVARGGSTAGFVVRRDWASVQGGGQVAAFDGPDLSQYGCGPAQAIDLSLGSGWVSTAGDDAGTPTATPVPKAITVRLPQPVDVSAIAVDPANACGLAGSASTAGYRIEVSTDGKAWRTASDGTFGRADRGRLNELAVAAAETRFVRFTIRSPQVPDISTNCPAGGYDGCSYLSLTELVVYGRSTEQSPAVAATGTGTGTR